jgi:hypothetical protein
VKKKSDGVRKIGKGGTRKPKTEGGRGKKTTGEGGRENVRGKRQQTGIGGTGIAAEKKIGGTDAVAARTEEMKEVEVLTEGMREVVVLTEELREVVVLTGAIAVPRCCNAVAAQTAADLEALFTDDFAVHPRTGLAALEALNLADPEVQMSVAKREVLVPQCWEAPVPVAHPAQLAGAVL